MSGIESMPANHHPENEVLPASQHVVSVTVEELAAFLSAGTLNVIELYCKGVLSADESEAVSMSVIEERWREKLAGEWAASKKNIADLVPSYRACNQAPEVWEGIVRRIVT